MALNGLFCADLPLRSYSLTETLEQQDFVEINAPAMLRIVSLLQCSMLQAVSPCLSNEDCNLNSNSTSDHLSSLLTIGS